MKIKKIKIENFGKLSGFELDLADGINTLVKENGWGKSTLAAFIKVMFFGPEKLKGEKGGADVNNERKRYKPWAGGVLGGSIVFEAGGKEYRLLRTFGNTEKDDSFELFDNATGLRSEDYSVNIGEELFDLDAESFRKTVYISQNDIETASNGKISAKVGGLASVTDDIDSFEAVDEKFKDKLNSISSKRKTGEINRMMSEKSGLEADVRGIPVLDDAISAKLSEIEGLKAAQQGNKEVLNELGEELKKASESEKLAAKKANYESILSRVSERGALLDAAEAAFPMGLSGLSGLEELPLMKDKALELSALEKQYAALQFSEEEQADYDRLKKTYDGKEELIGRVSAVSERLSLAKSKKEALSVKEASLSAMKSALPKAKQSLLWVILLVLGIGFCAAGAALVLAGGAGSAAAGKTLGIIGMGLGATLAVAGILVKVLAKVPQADISGIESFEKEIEADRLFIADTEKEAAEYLSAFDLSFSFETGPSALTGIMMDGKRFADLSAKLADQRDDELLEKINGLKSRLESFILPYAGLAGEGDFLSRLSAVYYEAQSLVRAKEEYDKALKEKDGFEAENAADMKALLSAGGTASASESAGVGGDASAAGPDGLSSLDVINAKIKTVTAENEDLSEKINGCNNQLNELLEKKDGLEEKKDRLADLSSETARLSERERIISLTRDYLTTAKSRFTARYSAPVADAFKKYYKILDGGEGKEFSFDANMELRIEDQGSTRNLHLYSEGSKDRISLCFRLALIDAMYKEEKPVIIMDDPFTNLDEKRLEGGKKLLSALGTDYQLLYLTCHDSRAAE